MRFILFFLFFFTSFAFADASHISKKRMFSDLDYIKNVFEIKYAPLNWKKRHHDWDLEREYAHARARICTLNKPTVKDFHRIVKDFLNSTRDYHVGIQFYATESAFLPLTIKGNNGRYFIVQITRSALPYSKFPVEVGDEVLAFDGKPIEKVIQNIQKEECGKNSRLTDCELAQLLLTYRRAERGCKIPKGSVRIEGARKNGQPFVCDVEWQYTPEFVYDFSRLKPNRNFSSFEPTVFSGDKGVRDFFNKSMTYGYWKPQSTVGESLTMENPYAIGARSSFLPGLGKESWSSKKEAYFDAYIFKGPTGEPVGYIRIPHFAGDEEEVKEFVTLIKKFQQETKALVIDQLNNPGGAVFYLYALLSNLCNQPMHTPHHRLTLTQEEVYTAYTILSSLNGVKNVDEAKTVLGESLSGYPVSMETVDLMNRFCTFVIDEWSSGKIFSDQTYLFGVDDIQPHPQASYTHPILVLTNPLNFSAADFFPAILQDNKRATILGTKTAGAGGFVFSNQFPNQTGIASFNLTASIAFRKNKQPIENLGVTPDIEYQLTPKDFQTNYSEYREKILDTLVLMLTAKTNCARK